MKPFFRTPFSSNDDGALPVIAGLAALKLVIHLLTSSGYGYFRDEFYYLAAGRHLAFGYVDFPPFIALLTHHSNGRNQKVLQATRLLLAELDLR